MWVLAEDQDTRDVYARHGFVADGQSEKLTGDWEGLTEIRMVRSQSVTGGALIT
ncbi:MULTISPECIES: hypothetical protein [Auritidibacter]|uniref:hypothetical protein n=1 Tax=Auritidibacter TaxID=1160973 RepID=UPI0013145D3D|nr:MULTISPECIES: hypothetical protein [Auritidibacter]NIH71720.1 hypothetical protein [Auritidibacter ignavus]WGH82641.1 hypothetical protein QDX25_05700 [Auritidibacter ignavus]